MSTRAIQQIVERVRRLPALSPAVLAALRVLDDPQSTARDVARVLLADQVVAAQLLRMANSAYYGTGRNVTTVSDAVTLLGFQVIRSLLMTVAMRPMLSTGVPGYGLQPGAMWQHSVAVAACGRQIAMRCGYRPPEEAFVAGLVHDIGKVALGYAMAERFRQVGERAATGEVDFLQAEREEFGVAHDDVGAMVARLWELPSALVDVISRHHRWDPAGEHARLTAIVHVADAACLMLGIGCGEDGLSYRVEEGAMEALGLTAEVVEEAMAAVNASPVAELWHPAGQAAPVGRP